MRVSRLTLALLGGLALPWWGNIGLAQTPSTSPSATRPVAPPPAPRPSASAAAAPSTASGKRIDINGATEQEIATLPGVGPVTAKAIVAGRPWEDLGDLVKKKAMNKPTYDRNKDQLALANINTSSATEMAKTLPSIGDKTAPKIVAGRPYATPQDLVGKKVISASQLNQIKAVITY